MSPTDELVPMLKRLRMSGVLESLELRVEQAVDDKASYPEFLFRVVSDEVETRGIEKVDPMEPRVCPASVGPAHPRRSTRWSLESVQQAWVPRVEQ